MRQEGGRWRRGGHEIRRRRRVDGVIGVEKMGGGWQERFDGAGRRQGIDRGANNTRNCTPSGSGSSSGSGGQRMMMRMRRRMKRSGVEFVRRSKGGGQVRRGAGGEDGGSQQRIDEARVDDADAGAENPAHRADGRFLRRTGRLLLLGNEHAHRLQGGRNGVREYCHNFLSGLTSPTSSCACGGCG